MMSNIFPISTIKKLYLRFKGSEYSYSFLPGSYLFEVWGAAGGGSLPGYGAFVSGILTIKSQQQLYFYIGQKGKNGASEAYNGGGIGTSGGSGGGGATDVRLINGTWSNFDSLKSRIIVAGAGGGSQQTAYQKQGGSGGIEKGDYGSITATGITISEGGQQTRGGKGGTGTWSGLDGEFGKGGRGSVSNENGNGGGAGYFGGGGSGTSPQKVGSGAGGSSYISGYSGCQAILENAEL